MSAAYIATVNGKDFGFDFVDQEIEVEAIVTDALAAELKVAIREAEASEAGIMYDQIGNMGNPVVLDPAGPISTALTVILLDSWRILSLAASGTFTVAGGNTVNVATGADIFASNTSVDMINRLSQFGVIVPVGSGLDVSQDQRLTRIEKFLRNRRETDPITGTQRVFDDDNATTLFEGDIFEDVAGSTPYDADSTGIDRADRLEDVP